MDLNDEEKMNKRYQYQTNTEIHSKEKMSDSFQNYFNGYIMDSFTKANLFVICCFAAALLLIAYLAAFSCEVSWLLEAKGDLPFSSYMLCAGYFIMFVASTILIHGLVTGLPWGLFSWSLVIGILSVPELALVMIMTTQYWGLQSTHGLTELVSYLIRLIINCVALICVIPTALKWRREAQIHSQLQNLANRLQLQTPPPSTPMSKSESQRDSTRKIGHSSRRSSAFDNHGYIVDENSLQNYYNRAFGSQNEFNASYYGQGGFVQRPVFEDNNSTLLNSANRAQSLMDLRCTLPGMYNPSKYQEFDRHQQYNIPNNLRPLKPTHLHDSDKSKNVENLSQIGSITDPIYTTIQEPKKSKTNKLSRNCISLENLGGIEKIRNDLSYGNNLLQNYHCIFPLNYQQQHHYQGPHHYNDYYSSPIYYYNAIPRIALGCGGIGYGGYTNPYANSKQSLGQESDDYRKYRDIAL